MSVRIPPSGGWEGAATKLDKSVVVTIVFCWVPAPASPPQASTSCGVEEPEAGVARATSGLVGMPFEQLGFIWVQVLLPVAWKNKSPLLSLVATTTP